MKTVVRAVEAEPRLSGNAAGERSLDESPWDDSVDAVRALSGVTKLFFCLA